MQSSTGSIIIFLIFLIVTIITISLIIYYSGMIYNNQSDDDGIETLKVNLGDNIDGQNIDEYLKYKIIEDHHSSDNNSILKYQEFEDDILVRGKSVYDFMNKKSQKVMKISKKQVIPNEIGNGSLIQIDGHDNHMLELPDVLNEGLSLTFFNNSHVKQTINSSSPIIISGSISLTISIPNDAILTLISNGTQWITLYQSYIQPIVQPTSAVESQPQTVTAETDTTTSTRVKPTLSNFISSNPLTDKSISSLTDELGSIDSTLDNLLLLSF